MSPILSQPNEPSRQPYGFEKAEETRQLIQEKLQEASEAHLAQLYLLLKECTVVQMHSAALQPFLHSNQRNALPPVDEQGQVISANLQHLSDAWNEILQRLKKLGYINHAGPVTQDTSLKMLIGHMLGSYVEQCRQAIMIVRPERIDQVHEDTHTAVVTMLQKATSSIPSPSDGIGSPIISTSLINPVFTTSSMPTAILT